LVVPEVNGDALLHALSKSVEDDDETIPLVKSPNCVSCGVSVVLKALDDAYGVVGVSITTFQALSGRGDAKYDPELVVGNVYPLRNTVERTDEYQRKELMRIFPLLKRCAVSAHRVPVQNGHFVDLKLQTKRPVTTKAEVKKIRTGPSSFWTRWAGRGRSSTATTKGAWPCASATSTRTTGSST
jgi:aspartate-semialdehyde dehydrogenase